MMRLTLICFTVAVVFSTTLDAQTGQPSSFSWPDGKAAAVCLTYDDGIDCHLDVAAPALERYNFRGTFYCPGYSESLSNRLEEWRDLVVRGHELGNHTLFHPCRGDVFHWVKPEYDLNGYTMGQLKNELRTANSLLKAVDGNEQRTFAYTCGHYTIDGISFVDSIRSMFVAARGSAPLPETMNGLDIHNVPSWGVVDPTGDELIAYVEEAREKGTVAVFMFHSVGGGYLNVSAEAHESLLQYLDQNRNEVWTDTFLNVMKYVKFKAGPGSSPR